ncbi:hypothetical protein [Prevotella sp.]|uniref:hypothetical protein n=1 Tax=Prevotella sp. TaxID=59823 RepID=UPI0025F24299|nr:hypothetical protein [Prevotella sp.]
MKLLLSILMIFSCLSLQAKDKGLTLKRGNTYYIYTSPDAPDVVKHAAAELDNYLTKAIGVHSRKKTAPFVAKQGVVVTAVANPAGFRMPETNKLGEDGYSMTISQNSIAFNSQYGQALCTACTIFWRSMWDADGTVQMPRSCRARRASRFQ